MAVLPELAALLRAICSAAASRQVIRSPADFEKALRVWNI
jgi:hypothetical protein